MSAAIGNDNGPPSSFATTLIDLMDRVEYRRVTGDRLDPVYRLRYEAYRREEFVPINAQEVVRDEFDDLPNAYCYGVYIDGQLVSSVRFHHLTRDFRKSLTYSIFPDVLDPLLDQGKIILDPGRFTADYNASLSFPALPFLTLRVATMAVQHFSADYVLNAVRSEHGAFYRRVFRSFILGEARHYHGLSFPIVLYACNISEMFADLLRRYPFFRSTPEEREMMFDRNENVRAIRPSVRLAQRLAEMQAEFA
ncbi:MAG TPA: acetyltransferase [Devosiaceae bacterium]|nr:acetyltransferase [Devosiaceae bacterium]